jgi:hypothetical protein
VALCHHVKNGLSAALVSGCAKLRRGTSAAAGHVRADDADIGGGARSLVDQAASEDHDDAVGQLQERDGGRFFPPYPDCTSRRSRTSSVRRGKAFGMLLSRCYRATRRQGIQPAGLKTLAVARALDRSPDVEYGDTQLYFGVPALTARRLPAWAPPEGNTRRCGHGVHLMGGAHGVPQRHADPRQQLVGTKGFADIVVGARVERRHLVSLLASRRQDDDRDRGPLAQPANDFETIDVREPGGARSASSRRQPIAASPSKVADRGPGLPPGEEHKVFDKVLSRRARRRPGYRPRPRDLPAQSGRSAGRG